MKSIHAGFVGARDCMSVLALMAALVSGSSMAATPEVVVPVGAFDAFGHLPAEKIKPSSVLPSTATSYASGSLKIVDGRGKTVTLNKPPLRIVSLLPSLTEAVCALGACQRLVGVDRYSNYPALVRQLPVVGGGIDPNVEAVFALRPDVVLLTEASRAAPRLEALGLRVIALEPRNHADVRRVLGILGQVLAVPEAQGPARLWTDIQQSMAQVAATVPVAARGQRVYFEASRGPYAAGESSFIGETLAILGMRNIVGANQGPFPRLNPEFVVRADPDLIMSGERHSTKNADPYPGWEAMRAVRHGRVCRFKPEESNVLIRPGPRMAEGARLMAECIRKVGP